MGAKSSALRWNSRRQGARSTCSLRNSKQFSSRAIESESRRASFANLDAQIAAGLAGRTAKRGRKLEQARGKSCNSKPNRSRISKGAARRPDRTENCLASKPNCNWRALSSSRSNTKKSPSKQRSQARNSSKAAPPNSTRRPAKLKQAERSIRRGSRRKHHAK